MTRFILLAAIRSGTNFFRSALNSHPDVHMFGEALFDDWAFRPDREENFYVQWHKAVMRDPAQITFRNMNAFARRFIDATFDSMSRHSIVGMDIKYDFWDRLAFVSGYFSTHPPKVVHLIRTNTLRAHISAFLLACRNRGVDTGTLPMREYDGFVRTGETTLTVTLTKRLLGTLVQLEKRKQRFRAIVSDFEHVEITYEDMVGHVRGSAHTFSPQTQAKLFPFLGIDPAKAPVTTDYQKVSPDALSDIIDNYDQLVPELTRLGLSRYADERATAE